MIYLEETYNLVPASPETMDVFVEFAHAHQTAFLALVPS